MDFKAIQNHVNRYVNCDPAHATQWLLVALRQGKARQGKAKQGTFTILASCVYKIGNAV